MPFRLFAIVLLLITAAKTDAQTIRYGVHFSLGNNWYTKGPEGAFPDNSTGYRTGISVAVLPLDHHRVGFASGLYLSGFDITTALEERNPQLFQPYSVVYKNYYLDIPLLITVDVLDLDPVTIQGRSGLSVAVFLEGASRTTVYEDGEIAVFVPQDPLEVERFNLGWLSELGVSIRTGPNFALDFGLVYNYGLVPALSPENFKGIRHMNQLLGSVGCTF